MKKELMLRFANIVLRTATMVSRFVLIFILAKLLAPAALGEFGLILVTITFCVMILGGDFHSYSMREINMRPSEEWSFVIQHHAVAQLGIFLVIYPLILMLFFLDYLHISNLLCFSLLLVLELASQELHWLLIGMQKPILSSFIMFVRSALWVYIVLPLMFYYPNVNNIQSVLIAWSIGVSMAIVLGGYSVWKSVPYWKLHEYDALWIKKGLKVGAYFLLASLSIKGLLTFDRFAIDMLGQPEELGIYVFYISIVMGGMNFLEPAVFSFLYPKMIQFYHQGNMKKYSDTYRELRVSTIVISVFIAIVTWFVTPYLIQWVNKPVYEVYYSSFPLLIMSGVVYAMGMIPHYGLYAMKKDRWIVGAQISAIIIYLLVVFFVEFDTAINTVSVALLAAFSWMASVKLIGYLKLCKSTF